MHILVTGGTGFIGQALLPALRADGHELTVLSRTPHVSRKATTYICHLDELGDDVAVDAIINLAGASLAGRRWNPVYKDEIVASRIDTTRSLVKLCGRLVRPPAVLLNASAIGYYGSRGDETLDEQSQPGAGFAAELCKQWEQEAALIEAYGVRSCIMRLGVVLGRDGGALQEMARPFRFGVANWIGSGKQWLSWIQLDDVVAAMRLLLGRDDLSGVFNLTAPQPATSRQFCEAMKRQRKTFLTAPVPAIAMRLLVGEMAEELLLNGQRVLPGRLLAAGFAFSYPALDEALEASL